MFIVTCSPDVVAPGVKNHAELVQVLAGAAQNNPVGLISNGPEPEWFKSYFDGTNVQFIRTRARQSGEIIKVNANKFGLKPYDVLVLAGKSEDIQMGKNGGAVLVAAGWSGDTQVQDLGIRVVSPAELETVINLTSEWPGHWWFEGNEPNYRVRALADLSKYGHGISQQIFGQKLTITVKNGGGRLNALLAITARSLLIDEIGLGRDWVWGVFPSSSSGNNDSEVLSDFTHRLRTTVSRVRFAPKGEPLFIRHTPSAKRSGGGGTDRENPAGQIETLHLNPFFKTRNRLRGKHVVVVDDCTTYGLSFGVAAAFLHKAGAATITGVALGKFGSQLKYYEIVINSDPFAPIPKSGYSVTLKRAFTGATSNVAQDALRALIP